MLTKEFLEYVELFINKTCPNKRKTKVSVFYCLEKIIKVLSCGFSWCHLECSHCHFTTIYKRFKYWVTNGVFEALWKELTRNYISNRLKQNASYFKVLFIDSTMIKNIHGSDLLGKNHFDRNRLATKMLVYPSASAAICDKNKVPLSVSFYPANNHDALTIETSLEAIPCAIHRNKRYRSYLIGDKGYISKKENKDHLQHKHRINLVTPFRKNQKDTVSPKQTILLYSSKFKKEHHDFKQFYSFSKVERCFPFFIFKIKTKPMGSYCQGR